MFGYRVHLGRPTCLADADFATAIVQVVADRSGGAGRRGWAWKAPTGRHDAMAITGEIRGGQANPAPALPVGLSGVGAVHPIAALAGRPAPALTKAQARSDHRRQDKDALHFPNAIRLLRPP